MSLVAEYRRQFAWRDWKQALLLCPISSGQRILDLGCGPGDISAELFRRGALVTGVDRNAELLAAAKELCPECTFEKQDLNFLQLASETFDGLWCSFAAAYFTEFSRTVSCWMPFLKRNAWICVVDIDDLLAHEPLSERTQQRIGKFYEEALKEGRHDFLVGRKIENALRDGGFRVTTTDLKDKELSFNGSASSAVIQAWIDRLNRMGGLKTFLKDEFVSFRDEFIECLASADHRSRCRVVCCVGSRI